MIITLYAATPQALLVQIQERSAAEVSRLEIALSQEWPAKQRAAYEAQLQMAKNNRAYWEKVEIA